MPDGTMGMPSSTTSFASSIRPSAVTVKLLGTVMLHAMVGTGVGVGSGYAICGSSMRTKVVTEPRVQSRLPRFVCAPLGTSVNSANFSPSSDTR